MPIGIPHLQIAELGSTNDTARELAAAGAPHGTMVSATVQTAGRGRQGRSWTNPPGVMAQSFVLRESRCTAELLPIAAAVAVARTCGEQTQVKWPNDVWLSEGRKLAGILIETRSGAGWWVLGIGINVAVDPADLGDAAARATTLGQPVASIPRWRRRLVAELQTALALPTPELLDAWRERDGLLGREIAWEHGSGVAAGIDDSGRLLVRVSDAEVTALVAGEVHLQPLVS